MSCACLAKRLDFAATQNHDLKEACHLAPKARPIDQQKRVLSKENSHSRRVCFCASCPPLVLQYDVQRMDDTGNVAENGKQDLLKFQLVSSSALCKK